MAIYSISQRTSGVTSGNAAMDVANPTASGMRARLMEMGCFLGAATASTYSLARCTALGTRTTPTALAAEDGSDPTLSNIALVDSAVAWSVQPTISATDFRRIGLPATIGTGVIWTFPRGLVITQALSVALTNRATNGVVDCHAVCDV
jgi:hypothetical protein